MCWLQDLLEYKSKLRKLRIKTMDEMVKTMYVDDSLPVSQLMVTICSKMCECLTPPPFRFALPLCDVCWSFVAAITNHDEYSLIREVSEEEKEKTLTLRRRDQKDVEKMKKKWRTDERKSTYLPTPFPPSPFTSCYYQLQHV